MFAALKDAVSPPVLRRLSLMSRLQQTGDTAFEHPAGVRAPVAERNEEDVARIRWAQLIKRVFKKTWNPAFIAEAAGS